MNIETATEIAQEKDTGRIEAYSDSIFTIAATLLVLELKLPHAENADLVKALAGQWPAYLSFLISFFTILIMWINHHSLFKCIKRCDGVFTFLNGVLLLTVTVLPFPTSLISKYLHHPQAGVAAAVYAGTFLCNCGAFTLMWWYAARHRHIAPESALPGLRQGIRWGVFGIALYIVAMGLAFVSVYASVGMCMALAAFFAVTGMMHQKTAR